MARGRAARAGVVGSGIVDGQKDCLELDDVVAMVASDVGEGSGVCCRDFDVEGADLLVRDTS